MSERIDRASAWIYRGFWRTVANWLMVPPPPTLPARPGEKLKRFHPAPGFLGYLRFWFWVILIVYDGVVAAVWIAIFINNRALGLALAPVFLVAGVLPDIIVYIAIHLRYDTTWYIMSERSMRLRRGVWVVSEITISYENIQNVKVRSGPLQRAFGIADVIVETAGSGSGSGEGGQGSTVNNRGLIEGIDNAQHIRDQIMRRVRASRSTGLGDESSEREPPRSPVWTAQHLETLRSIRDEVKLLTP